ncbi:MAG TPA: acetate/propionate family kinase [Stellaceae bacterium]|nr:acetate/propionate family kinase [Stellaceae bacterium]
MPDAILTVNAGSSSIKFAVYRIGEDSGGLALAAKGLLEGIGTAPRLAIHDAAGRFLAQREWAEGGTLRHEDLLAAVLDEIQGRLDGSALRGAGHRVVHGGADFTAPAVATPPVMSALEALVPLAPLHQPHNLAPVRALAAARPELPQVVCFDTAFHRTMPAVARGLALPRRYEGEGIRRYGFHGLSYEFIAGRLADIAPQLKRVVVAHLGNGASLCALRDGCSIDTTMSFTALDGLVMGTRCGALDPGVLLYLLQQGSSAAELEDLLYHRSGLLGVSGLASDMRELLASPRPEAKEAVELFVYRIAQHTAAMAAALGGIDGLVFTAGIGEHAAPIRAAVCRRLGWLGIAMDEAANERHAERISTTSSVVAVMVIPTDEELTIACHTLAMIGGTRR